MRLLVGAVLLSFLPGVAVAFWEACARLGRTESLLAPLAAGFAVGLVVERLLERRFRRAGVFEHELTHAVAALLLLRPIHEFTARRDGGYVRHGGGFGGEVANDIIGLAPYVLPTFTAFSILARPFLGPSWFPWFDAWVGLTLGFHTVSTLRETREAWTKTSFRRAGAGEHVQSDIGRRGFIYSAIFISTLTLAIHGVLFAILLRGYRGVPGWGERVWGVTKEMLAAAAAYGVRLVEGV